MRYAYFPGCSLKASAREYDLSTQEVFNRLGIGLVEIEDWCCCGSTPAHMTNELLSVALPVENLLWAQERGLDVTTPCAACFDALKTATSVMENDSSIKKKVEEVVEADYTGTVSVKHSLDVVVNEYGLERVKEHLKVDLDGLKAACYYGCLLTRPPKVKKFDDPEDPKAMDELVGALGAKPVQWGYKTACCGASFALTTTEVVEKLSYDILRKAKKREAQCVVVGCPLCHSNLDMRQADIEAKYGISLGLPVFYFTQLMGIAMGIDPELLGLDRNMVEPWEIVEEVCGERLSKETHQ